MKKRVGALVVAVVALTAGVAMAVDAGHRPWTVVANNFGSFEESSVFKICDHGRAVYVADVYRGGGIAVVPNAPECQFGR